ncbi:MAG: serine hydrolase domain-containing protein [Erythrobacter sp.]
MGFRHFPRAFAITTPLLWLAGVFLAPTAAAAPPAAVAVGFDREQLQPLLAQGFARRPEARPVGFDDPVRIASISKLVVALGVMRLVEAGQLELDRDVSYYLGWKLRNPAFPKAPVTLRMLLAHRAGVVDGAGYVIPFDVTLREWMAEADRWDPAHAPGEAPFAYANLNTPVIATVVERATGERFDRAMERLVFAPLGVEACFNWTGCSEGFARRAVTLYRHGGEVAADDRSAGIPPCTVVAARDGSCDLARYVPGTNASIFSPQGGLRISMLDLARIGQAIARREAGFLSTSSWDELARPAGPRPDGESFFCSFGLSMQITGTDPACADDFFRDGRARIGHAGEAYALRSGLWVDPVTGRGIAFFVTEVPVIEGADADAIAPAEYAIVRRALEALEPAG